MKISELEELLKYYREWHGDIEVMIEQQDSIGETYIDEITQYSLDIGSKFIKEDIHENVIIIS